MYVLLLFLLHTIEYNVRVFSKLLFVSAVYFYLSSVSETVFWVLTWMRYNMLSLTLMARCLGCRRSHVVFVGRKKHGNGYNCSGKTMVFVYKA
jgi:hypothetical protein